MVTTKFKNVLKEREMKLFNFNQIKKSNSEKRTPKFFSSIIVIMFSFMLLTQISYARGNTYYSKGNLAPNLTSSWSSTTNGSGGSPSNFNNANDIFIVQNGDTMTTTSTWTISGDFITITIANGGVLIGNHSINFKSTNIFGIQDGGKYIHNNTSNPFSSGIFDGTESFTTNSNFVIYKWYTDSLNSGITFGNLEVGGLSTEVNFKIPTYTFNILTVNRTNGITLRGNVTINDSLKLTAGVLTTSTSSVIFTNTAYSPTEISTSRIDGTAVMQSRTIGTGSFNFLGAYFAAGTDNLGNVTITRKTGTIAIGSNNSNQSIACNWDIVAQNQPVNGRNMTYNWLSAYDNNIFFGTNNRGQVYYSTDNGSTWAPIGSLVNPVTSSTTRAITIATTHFSRWSIGSENGPLPVRLSSFTSSVKLNSVTLNWSTASEINNKGFEIERKEINSNDYTNVGFVDGKGTSNQNNNYSFTDSKLNTGKYSYRIKQVDFNGNFEYFSLNSGIEISTPKKFNLSQNYPNPFNPSTKIDYEIPADSKVQVIIYDISGKEVMQVVNEQQKAGFYTAQFNAGNLSSGTYFYKLTVNGANGSDVLTKKMTLIK
jgi:hypothetical protein